MAAAELIQFLRGINDEAAAQGPTNPLFEPAHTTLTVNMIEGGTAINIMAGSCTFQWDVRALPEDNPDRYVRRFMDHCTRVVLPRMRAVAPSCNIETAQRSGTPGLKPERQSEAEQLCRMLTGDNEMRAVSFAAEAGQFQQKGMSTVICGPGSISQAHQPNEYIEISQVEAGTKFMLGLIGHMSR